MEQSCKTETISCTSLKQMIYFARFTFIAHRFLKVTKGQGLPEREKVELGISKHLPRTYLSL